MRSHNQHPEVSASKDPENEGPIPLAWRATLKTIVDAFVRQDYGLKDGIPGVAPVLEETAAQIRDYIEEYGEQLVELPPEAWDTSVCIWSGNHWDVLVDLWTEEEGSSDLVLQVHVFEADRGYLLNVHMVYVP